MKNIYILTSLLLIALNTLSQSITSTEAIEYDPTGNRFLITNESRILQQDSGSDDLNFFGDGAAGLGMEVMNGKLFAISESVEAYDLVTEAEEMSLDIPGSSLLNGMASDGANNRIWVTDFDTNKIHEIDVTDLNNPVATEVVSNTVCTPNGITYDEANNRLVHTCWTGGDIRSIDLTDYSSSILINTGLEAIDGIDHDENGNFYISSWDPTRITKLSNEFTTEETITAPGLSLPADISYAVGIDTLAIADPGVQNVFYISFAIPDNVSEINQDFSLFVYPNPISESSYIEFELKQNSKCALTIYDTQGKLVHELLQENLSAGKHKVLLSGLALEQGTYICELTTNTKSQTISLIKK